ncbi:MAG: hypothetical protein CL867_09250 [Cytophagaceae bacterium]|nr:hypothetical protein [Cytophagaceae bacterium]
MGPSSAFAKAYTNSSPTTLAATQCAMCRAVLESEEDNSTAKGVNNGIKYLMIIPYILVGGVFYAIYRSRKKQKQALASDLEDK